MNVLRITLYIAVSLGYTYLVMSVVFLGRDDFRTVNFVPFASIREFFFVDNGVGQTRIVDMNIWGNILLFVPFGVYVVMHIRQRSWLFYSAVFMLASLFIEVTQYIFRKGSSDIDDILLNTCGGIIGLLFYKCCNWLLQTRTRTDKTIQWLSVLVGLPVLVVATLLWWVNL